MEDAKRPQIGKPMRLDTAEDLNAAFIPEKGATPIHAAARDMAQVINDNIAEPNRRRMAIRQLMGVTRMINHLAAPPRKKE